MSDTYTVTTHQSWFSRIGNSFAGALIGVAVVGVALVFLFWNEGRAVTTARSLEEGSHAVVSVASNRADPANEGKLVHVNGPLSTGERPADPAFGISAEGVRLVRRVEMYQWRESSRSESQKKLGGGEDTVTTYTYDRSWEDSPVNSSEFKQPNGHANPSMNIQDETFGVDAAKLGAFDLHKPALDAISWTEKQPVTGDQLAAIKAAHGGTTRVSVADGGIYLGWNPSAPAVGDYRIRYERVPLGEASMIARQDGSTLNAYQTRAGDRLLLAARGAVPADQMFADAVTGNTILTWVLRAVGFLVLGIGFALILAPVGVLADVIPLLGSIVRMGTGSIALLLTFVTGSAVIALAWLWYRPLVALGILAVGLLAGFGLARLFRRKKTVSAPDAQPQATAA